MNQGVTNGTYTVQGEAITIIIKNGVLEIAYGPYTLGDNG